MNQIARRSLLDFSFFDVSGDGLWERSSSDQKSQILKLNRHLLQTEEEAVNFAF